MLKNFDYLLIFALFFSFLFLLNFTEAKTISNTPTFQSDINVADRNGWIDIDYANKLKDANINYAVTYRLFGVDYNYNYLALSQPIKEQLGAMGITDLNNFMTYAKFANKFNEPATGHLKRWIYQIRTNDKITISDKSVYFADTQIDFSDVDTNGCAVSMLKWNDYNVEVIANTPDSNSAITCLDPVVSRSVSGVSTQEPRSKVARSPTDNNVSVVWEDGNIVHFGTSPFAEGNSFSDINFYGATFPSIDVNSTGGWIMSLVGSDGNLGLRTCSKDCNISVSNWSFLASIANTANNASLVVDADNNIHITWAEAKTVKYTMCSKTGVSCSAPITISIVAGDVVRPRDNFIDRNSSGGKGITWSDNHPYGNVHFAECSKDCNASSNNWLDLNMSSDSNAIVSQYTSVIASADNNWHIIYSKQSPSVNEVQYRRCAGNCSIIGSWVDDVNLSENDAGESIQPTFTIDSNSTLHAFWEDVNAGNTYNLLYKRRFSASGWDANYMVVNTRSISGSWYSNARRRTTAQGTSEFIDYVDRNGTGVFFETNSLAPLGAGAPANNPIDANTTKIDGNPDNLALPVFSYNADGNLTIDFNVFDLDYNGIFLGSGRLDANIDFRTADANVSTRIITDLNLTRSKTTGGNAGLYCDDLNFAGIKDNNKYGTTCHWDWNISPALMADGNFWIDINVTDNNGSTDANSSDFNIGIKNQVNNPIDANTIRVDGNADNVPMRYYSYAYDGNLTIDFNVFDKDWNGNFWGHGRLDANIAFRDTNGLTTRFITDLNLLTSNASGKPLYCDDLNFAGGDKNKYGATCHWDWNIALVTDRNVFIDINVTDNNGSTDTNSSDFNFGIDGTKPTISVRQPIDKNANVTSNIITFDVNDSGGAGVRLSSIVVDINNVRSNTFVTGTHCTRFGDDYYCTYGENDFNISDTNYNITIFATDDANNSVADANYFTIIYTGGVTLVADPSSFSISISASTGTKTQGVTITNSGTATSGPLTIASSCSASLTSISKVSLPAIAPNGTDNYTITFTPTGTGGTYNCTITVSNTDASTTTSVTINETTGDGEGGDDGGGGGPAGPAGPTAPPTLPGPAVEEYTIESVRIGLQNYEVGKTIKLMLAQGTTETMQIIVRNLTDKKFDAFNLTSDCGDIIRIEPTPGLFSAMGEPLLDTTIDANGTKTLTIQLKVAAERKEEEIKCSIFAQETEIPLELQIVRRTLFSDIRNILGVRFFGLRLGLIGLVISGIVTVGIIDSMRKRATPLHALFALVFIGIIITIVTSGAIL